MVSFPALTSFAPRAVTKSCNVPARANFECRYFQDEVLKHKVHWDCKLCTTESHRFYFRGRQKKIAMAFLDKVSAFEQMHVVYSCGAHRSGTLCRFVFERRWSLCSADFFPSSDALSSKRAPISCYLDRVRRHCCLHSSIALSANQPELHGKRILISMEEREENNINVEEREKEREWGSNPWRQRPASPTA